MNKSRKAFVAKVTAEKIRRRLYHKSGREREKMKMEKHNENERKTMVACMEYIVRNLNDEDVFMPWLSVGVADGDLNYRMLIENFSYEKDNVDDYYIEKENFSEIMGLFLRLMARANKSGGLYCNGVVSR